MDRGASQIDMLSFMEFTYNNSYQVTIHMALYETFYRRKYKSTLYQDEIGKKDTLTQILEPKMTQK